MASVLLSLILEKARREMASGPLTVACSRPQPRRHAPLLTRPTCPAPPADRLARQGLQVRRGPTAGRAALVAAAVAWLLAAAAPCQPTCASPQVHGHLGSGQ